MISITIEQLNKMIETQKINGIYIEDECPIAIPLMNGQTKIKVVREIKIILEEKKEIK